MAGRYLKDKIVIKIETNRQPDCDCLFKTVFHALCRIYRKTVYAFSISDCFIHALTKLIFIVMNFFDYLLVNLSPLFFRFKYHFSKFHV